MPGARQAREHTGKDPAIGKRRVMTRPLRLNALCDDAGARIGGSVRSHRSH
jgi:hypothetical protein